VIRSNLEAIEKKCAGWISENPESPDICPDTPATHPESPGIDI
jgi:hypothetical protein